MEESIEGQQAHSGGEGLKMPPPLPANPMNIIGSKLRKKGNNNS